MGFIRLVAMVAIAWLTACAGTATSNHGGITGSTPSTDGRTWGLGQPSKLAAAVFPAMPQAYPQGRMLLGCFGEEQFPGHRVALDAQRVIFQPEFDFSAPQFSDAAYALYEFNMEGFDGPARVTLDWDGPGPPYGRSYVGLGNTLDDHWDWHDMRGLNNLALDSLEPYISEQSRLLLAVVVVGTQPFALESVLVGESWKSTGVDLNKVFAPVCEFEREAMRAEYASRNPVDDGFRNEGQMTTGSGYRYRVISHVVDGLRHYAGIRLPPDDGVNDFYIMIQGHPGVGGASSMDPDNLFDWLMDDQAAADKFLVLVPSFRGESLNGITVGMFTSEGEPSLWDRDADDTIAMLDAVINNVPEANPDIVIMFGYSRGAQVAFRAAHRDPRFDGAAMFCGFTDEWCPEGQFLMESILPQLQTNDIYNDPYIHMVWDTAYGTGDEMSARMWFMSTSTIYFANDMPRTQAHFGALDEGLPLSHAYRYVDVMEALGKEHECYIYPNAGHSPHMMEEAPQRFHDWVVSFLPEVDQP